MAAPTPYNEASFWEKLTLGDIDSIQDHAAAVTEDGRTPLMMTLLFSKDESVVKKMIEIASQSPKALEAEDDKGRLSIFYINDENKDYAYDPLLKDLVIKNNKSFLMHEDVYSKNCLHYIAKNSPETMFNIVNQTPSLAQYPPFNDLNELINLSVEAVNSRINTLKNKDLSLENLQTEKNELIKLFSKKLSSTLNKHAFDKSAAEVIIKKTKQETTSEDVIMFLNALISQPKNINNIIAETPMDEKPTTFSSDTAEDEVAAIIEDEGRIVDRGTHFESIGFLDKGLEAERMIEKAIGKGWNNISLDGDPVYVESAIKVAIMAGLEVTPKDNDQLQMIKKITASIKTADERPSATDVEGNTHNTVADSGEIDEHGSGPSM